MKLILLISLFLTIKSTAQITKDSLMTKMSNEACAELTKNKNTKFTADNYESQLMMLLLPALTKNLPLIQKVYGISMSDSKGMKKVGEDLGIRLVTDCPVFMQMIMQVYKDKKDDDTELPGIIVENDTAVSGETTLAEATTSTLNGDDEKKVEMIRYTPPTFTNAEVTGTLVSISTTEFSALNIKDSKGKTEKIYWMQYFEDADYFQKNQAKFIGKKVTYTYTEKEVYNAATKDYKTIKVLNSITLN